MIPVLDEGALAGCRCDSLSEAASRYSDVVKYEALRPEQIKACGLKCGCCARSVLHLLPYFLFRKESNKENSTILNALAARSPACPQRLLSLPACAVKLCSLRAWMVIRCSK